MVQETLKGVKRNHLYFLAEEGFRKINASDRWREYLAMKFSQRAEIEMRYIKLLQDWLEELAPPREKDDGSECYMDTEVIKRLTSSLRSEASQVIDTRQRVYNCLMAEDGPYSRLQTAHVPTSKLSSISELRETYSQLDTKRSAVEKDHRRFTEAREHLRIRIEDLESQLSQRSRLTTSRRPSTRSGTRKIDDMRSKLSELRLQNEEIQSKVESLETDLQQLQKDADQPLSNIDKDLQEMDIARTRVVVQQTQLFISHLRDLCQKKPMTDAFGIESDLLKAQWAEVQANARRVELGEQFKLRELFEVIPQKPKSRLDGLVTKTLGSNPPASEIRTELSNLQNRSIVQSPVVSEGRVDRTASRGIDRTASPGIDRIASPGISRIASPCSSYGRYWPASDNQTESTCSEIDRIEHLSVYEGEHRSTKAPPSTISNESIEELFLPPEVRCPAEITRTEPNKQYSPKFRVTRRKTENPNPPVQITEFRPVSRYSPDAYDGRSTADAAELARQRDVRVVAVSDNLATPGSNILPFKKGQIIKQKAGVNEDGYCYGWTRDRPLTRKQYGFYRPCLVRPQAENL